MRTRATAVREQRRGHSVGRRRWKRRRRARYFKCADASRHVERRREREARRVRQCVNNDEVNQSAATASQRWWRARYLKRRRAMRGKNRRSTALRKRSPPAHPSLRSRANASIEGDDRRGRLRFNINPYTNEATRPGGTRCSCVARSLVSSSRARPRGSDQRERE